ncbi:hypothetical protein QEN19_000918 [Hanseniaspora menglaensis]
MKQLIILNKDSIKFLNKTFLEYTKDTLNEMIKEDITKYDNFLKNFLFETNIEELAGNEAVVSALNDYNDMVVKENTVENTTLETLEQKESLIENISPVVNLEELYMINKEHNLAKYAMKDYSKDRYGLIGGKLSPAQMDQYDLFKATKLPRSTVKKIILAKRPENVGLANNNQTLLSILAGMLKLELLKVVEKAKYERNKDIKKQLHHLKSHRLFLMKETLSIVKVLVQLYSKLTANEEKGQTDVVVRDELNHQIGRYNKRVEFLKESSIDKSPGELMPLTVTHLRRVINTKKTKKTRLKYLR